MMWHNHTQGREAAGKNRGAVTDGSRGSSDSDHPRITSGKALKPSRAERGEQSEHPPKVLRVFHRCRLRSWHHDRAMAWVNRPLLCVQ